MEGINSDDGDNVEILTKAEVTTIWDEYKYRHEHVWKTVFSLTGAVVLLSVIPYLYPRVTCVLGWRTGVSLFVGIILYLFGFLRLLRELKRFDKIKYLYRDHQYEKYGFEKSMGNFPRDVKAYLIGLGIVAFGNIWIFVYWLSNIDCDLFFG